MGHRDLSDRLWAKVQKSSGCWLWTASVNNWGYGTISVGDKPDRKAKKVHRVVWELTYGPIPEGMCVLHHCDTPPCVRPSHLWLGTHGDNARDRSLKGRTVLARPVGEKNHWAKLTNDDIRAIRQVWSGESHPSGRELAAEYGITRRHLHRILGGYVWGHL